MNKEELKKAMLDDPLEEGVGTKIDTAREKRHSSLTLIGEAIRLLSNQGLKKNEIIEAVGKVAEIAGETPAVVKKITDAIFKNYQSAWDKASERLENKERFEPKKLGKKNE